MRYEPEAAVEAPSLGPLGVSGSREPSHVDAELPSQGLNYLKNVSEFLDTFRWRSRAQLTRFLFQLR